MELTKSTVDVHYIQEKIIKLEVPDETKLLDLDGDVFIYINFYYKRVNVFDNNFFQNYLIWKNLMIQNYLNFLNM